MKTIFSNLLRLTVSALALGWVMHSRAAEGEAEAPAVSSPTKRQEVVDMAKQMLSHHDVVPVKADPFHPAGFDELVAAVGRPPGTPASTGPAEEARPAAPRTQRDVLQSIANGLKPSGFYVLGGQPTLVFGQKRVKAGGSMTITFEGTEYTVEITAISPPNFTLRLNREEFTRTIK
jgi:hypothetical protein